ncbi:T9SS type A sorting domain-containing protein [Flavobacterium sp.]|uniref:T9SS type A sorting domain-containing protein n=1 Tax=Flavobacterium sp. TaxID=239 RepID=UPI0037BF16AA
MAPNPSSEIVFIDLVDKNNSPDKEAIISGTLFDLMGKANSKVQITDNKATLSVQGLKKGIYVLEILINDYIETHQIVVE